MATPNLDLPQIPQNALQISTPYNEAMQTLDGVVQCGVQSVENSPPFTVAPGDVGKCWLVGTSPTGAFAGHANNLAMCVGTNLWKFYAPGTQVKYFLNLANAGFYKFDGTSWGLAGGLGDAPSDGKTYVRKDGAWIELVAPTPPPPAIVDEATTARAATVANAGQYTRFTNLAAKTYTFASSQTYVAGAEYHGRNVGAGNLTLVGSGITLNPPAGGSLVIAAGGTFTVKMVSATVGDVIGVTVAP